MKRIVFILIALNLNITFAQVGIGNIDPKSTLDVSASDVANPANNDGILVPRMNAFPAVNPGADQDGMMVFITNDTGTAPIKGFYYWDNTISAWISIKDNTTLIEVKFAADYGVNQGSAGPNANFVGWNKISFNTEIQDSNNEYDPATGTFTAKKEGYYSITAYVVSTFNESAGAEPPVGIAIYKNAARWHKVSYRNTQYTDFSRTVIAVMYLNMGDTIEVYFGFPETWANFNNLAENKSRLVITSQD